ncbi:MAG TPA: hypothetical protein DIC42_04455 [Holosporales bacterium]|nr:hypothetical protein [Holosporales bacterium]
MDNQYKRLHYQSCHRGTKELDILLGLFFKETGYLLQQSEIDVYEQFLQEDDDILYRWLTMTTPPLPQKYERLIQRIQEFHQS